MRLYVLLAAWVATVAAGQTPPATDPVRDFNLRLMAELEAKAKAITAPTAVTVSGQRGTVMYQADRPTNRTDAGVMGQILVRDTYVHQLRAFSDALEAVRTATGADKAAFVTQLRAAAKAVDDAYVNMMGAERSVHEADARNSRVSSEAQYKETLKQADARAAAGDAAGAERLRREAADSGYGLFVQRRQQFFETLDDHPLLGLGSRGLVTDTYLFKALMRDLPANAPLEQYTALVDRYLEQGRDQVRAEMDRAAKITSVSGLREFGGAKYERQQAAAAAAGERGSSLPGQLVDAARGSYEVHEGGREVEKVAVDMGLTAIAGGAWIIPGLGPLISVGAGALQAIKEGNELVIAVLDAEQARDVAALRGFTKIITAEDRVAAERGEFGLALAAGVLEGVNAVRIVRGRPPAAPRATPAPAPAPNRVADAAEAGVDPFAKTAPHPAPPPPPPSAAAGNATVLAPEMEAVYARGLAKARELGINPDTIESMANAIRRRRSALTQEDRRLLQGLAELDEVIDAARRLDIPKAAIDEAVARAAAEGTPEAFVDQLTADLGVLRSNMEQRTIYVPPHEAESFAEFTARVPSNATIIQQDPTGLIRLDTKLRLAARGEPIEFTAAEQAWIRRVHELIAQGRGEEVFRLYDYTNFDRLTPIFRRDALDNVERVVGTLEPPPVPPVVKPAVPPGAPGPPPSAAPPPGATPSSITNVGDARRGAAAGVPLAGAATVTTSNERPGAGVSLSSFVPGITFTLSPVTRSESSSAACADGFECVDWSTCTTSSCGAFEMSTFDRSFRDPTVQAMVIDIVDVSTDAGGRAPLAPPGRVSLIPQRVAFDRSYDWLSLPPSGLRAVITSLGGSTGETFEITVVNDGQRPVKLSASGLVVEPLKDAAKQQVQKQLAALASKNPITARVNAYCLEFVRRPPSPGTLFRIAGPELQQHFAGMRRVLDASRRLQQAGLLKPDSEPQAYFHAIRQWAIWTRQEGFTQESFAKAFVSRTRENFERMKQKWTGELEKAALGVVPGRWRDITAVLMEAGK